MREKDVGVIAPYLDREIGNHGYRAQQLKLTRWAELTEHLAMMLGQPFAAALRGGALDVDALLDGNTVVGMLSLVVERLSASNLLKLLDLAARSLRLEADSGEYSVKKLAQWHEHFRQNMGELAPAMVLFLEAQYRDFFDGLKGSLPESTDEPRDPASTDQNTE